MSSAAPLQIGIKTSQQEAIRISMNEVVTETAAKATLPELIKSMISGEMSKSIFRKCKPIYPIKRIEIRKSEIIARDFEPAEPLPASARARAALLCKAVAADCLDKGGVLVAAVEPPPGTEAASVVGPSVRVLNRRKVSDLINAGGSSKQ